MNNFVADIIFIDAPASRIFESLVDPQAVLQWMGATEAEIGAWEDGDYRIKREDGVVASGVVAVLTPSVELRLRDFYWQTGEERRGPSRLHFQLDERDGGVWFGVRHEELDQGERWEPFAEEMRREWVRMTVALKRHVEGI